MVEIEKIAEKIVGVEGWSWRDGMMLRDGRVIICANHDARGQPNTEWHWVSAFQGSDLIQYVQSVEILPDPNCEVVQAVLLSIAEQRLGCEVDLLPPQPLGPSGWRVHATRESDASEWVEAFRGDSAIEALLKAVDAE